MNVLTNGVPKKGPKPARDSLTSASSVGADKCPSLASVARKRVGPGTGGFALIRMMLLSGEPIDKVKSDL